MPICKLTNKTLYQSSFMNFVFIFSEYTRLLFPKRLWKCAREDYFFRRDFESVQEKTTFSEETLNVYFFTKSSLNLY